MGNAAAVKGRQTWLVEVAASELGGVPGCKAYHTSILVGGSEYFFTEEGICEGSADLESHDGRHVRRSSQGNTEVAGSDLVQRLRSSFAAGSYDLLRKNCNSFTDVALVVLLGKRLDKRYRQLEQVGARFPQLVTTLSGGEYSPNPAADAFDLEKLCSDLKFGPSWATQGQTMAGDKVARVGASSSSKDKGKSKRGKQPALARVHVLPFQDTFELSFDHMGQRYVLPHMRSAEVADPEVGSGLHPGDEFSANGGRVRFRVVACDPASGGLPTDRTVLLCEGEPIERRTLRSVTMLPLESSMPLLQGKQPADLAREFVAPYLEQRAADLVVGQVHRIRDVQFKVVNTSPAAGGGPCVTTEIITTGLPVKVCKVAGCDGPVAKQCRVKECKRFVCAQHAADIKEMSCLCPDHAPKKGFLAKVFKR